MGGQPIPADIAEQLARRARDLGAFAQHPRYHATVSSTNDVAARLADAGAPEGTWVIADEQTAGRGRRGRTWESPPGAGLYLSVVFRPQAGAQTPMSTERGAQTDVETPGVVRGGADDRVTPLLTLMAGVAAVSGVRAATGLAPTLKWPNDLVIEPFRRDADREAGVGVSVSRFRKLAGILAEASAAGGALQFVIVGVGINLTPAAYPRDVEARATSIEGELGRPADRALVLVEVLAALAANRRRLLDGHAADVLQAWRAMAPSSVGRRVQWMAGERRVGGVTQGIDDRGALLVKTDAGLERVIAGEVHWE
jgi:BirA family transcriptional regulator, biotin operon repressor / biotin---[acetyl-CoA-carboxylase] ligase